jgi:HK97 gp10 family phage protein
VARPGRRGAVNVIGGPALQFALAELPKAVARGTLQRVLLAAAQPMVEAARALAPADTGYLRASIMVGTKKPAGHEAGKRAYAKAKAAGADNATAGQAMRQARRDSDQAFAEVFVGPRANTRSAMHQEFGTVFAAAQPYVRPAFDAEKAAVIETVGKELGGEIVRTATRLAARRAAKAAKQAG